MKFELHCHSFHSEGRKLKTEGLMSPDDIASELKKKGFGGFAVTDHDSTKAWSAARKAARKHDLVFIPGIEVSTASGHVLALGVNESIRPRMSMRETMEEIRSQGGIGVAAHPFDIRKEGVGNHFLMADAVEVFNSLNVTRVENMIAGRKARLAGKPMTAGSDAHTLSMLGLSINFINADDACSAIEEIKKGRVKVEKRYVSVAELTSWARGRMRASYDDVLAYADKNYCGPKARVSKLLLKRFVRSESPIWNSLGYLGLCLTMPYSVIRSLPYLAGLK